MYITSAHKIFKLQKLAPRKKIWPTEHAHICLSVNMFIMCHWAFGGCHIVVSELHLATTRYLFHTESTMVQPSQIVHESLISRLMSMPVETSSLQQLRTTGIVLLDIMFFGTYIIPIPYNIPVVLRSQIRVLHTIHFYSSR